MPNLTMDDRVAKLKTPEECEQFTKNVLARGRPDLAEQAKKRAIELRAADYGVTTQAEQECLQAIYAYEEVLSKNQGRRIRAGRTWPLVKKHGIIPAVERVVNRKQETAGYKALAEMGLQEFAFEAVVLRHPDLFSKEVVAISRERMEQWPNDSK